MFIVFFLTFLHVPFAIVYIYNFDFILLDSNQGVEGEPGANGLLGQAGAQVLYLLNIL